jgi:hypothetical protein
MSEPRIKSRLESMELSTNPKPIQDRLNACLASDPAHIQPGQKGDHIKVIQQALNTIRQRRPEIGLPEIKDAPGTYGGDTTAAVRKYKSFSVIIRSGQMLDPIVGRMTLTQLDEDLLKKPPSPAPTPPAKADIKVVAADIKKELAGDKDRDLEFLARLFEDDRIIDTGTGNELVNRLNTILAASSDGSNHGVTHFAGIYAGVTDLGFRKAFKDPFPGQSDNQVGHFTTAVDMGFRPQRTLSNVPQVFRDQIDWGTPTAFPKDEIICVRLIIGHEQVADDAPFVDYLQADSPMNDEIRWFFNALMLVTASPNQNINRSRIALFMIRTGTGQGNSVQDLHLSLFGFKFGKMIREGTITTRSDAALWIRTNIGTYLQTVDDPIPGPPTA